MPNQCSTKKPEHSATSSGASATPCSASTSSPTARTPSRSTSAGLDHLAFACPDRATLHTWKARLDELGVAHGGIVDAPYGSGLSFKDPDNLPLEIFAPPS